MGKAEDRARAERTRERGREEKAEQEAEAARAAARQTAEQERTAELLAASCHPLSYFGRQDFGLTVMVTCGLAFVSSAIFLFQDDEALRAIALPTMGGAVVLAAIGLAVRVSVASRMKAAWDLEAQWLGKLPFDVGGIDQGIASTSSSRELRVVLTFEVVNEMPLEKVRGMLPHVDPGAKAERSGSDLRITARIAGEPASDVGRVRARRLLFHDLVDGVLLPLHVEAPIRRLRLDD